MSAAATDTHAETEGPLEGSALVRATFPYMEESTARNWFIMATTLGVLGSAEALALMDLPLAIRLPAVVIAGLTWVRAFIIFHDARHGAMFRDSKAGRFLCDIVGFLLLSPPSVWKETHDYHHRNNAKLLGGAIGSYPVATPRMWNLMTTSQQRQYRFVRSPLNMLVAYFTVFGLGMCIGPFIRAPKQHWMGPASLLFHVALIVTVTLTLGFQAALLGVILPFAMAMTAGAYLFYAQHNFPDAVLAERRKWNYHTAALKSSSMMDMSPLMHWFTGNIGYHHIHHLNHRVPFYRLPECMAAIPELQTPGRTSWMPRDIRACFRLHLWDSRKNQWVDWDGKTPVS